MTKGKGKHLDIADRVLIQTCLRERVSLSEIARKLGVSTSTVSREIRSNRTRYLTTGSSKHHDLCVHYRDCTVTRLCDVACARTLCKKCRQAQCPALCPELRGAHLRALPAGMAQRRRFRLRRGRRRDGAAHGDGGAEVHQRGGVVVMAVRTRPTPRTPQRRPSDLAVALVCVLVIGILGLCAWLGMVITQPVEEEPEELPTHRVTHDSMAATVTYDGELIRWYVLVDPDFGIQYLVNDRGGCCVRLDSYGNVMGVSYEGEG